VLGLTISKNSPSEGVNLCNQCNKVEAQVVWSQDRSFVRLASRGEVHKVLVTITHELQAVQLGHLPLVATRDDRVPTLGLASAVMPKFGHRLRQA